MRKILIYSVIPVFLILAGLNASAQAINVNQILNGSQPSQSEMSSGLKQALELGITKSSDKLSAVNGFFANSAVKIMFPPEAQKAERTLRSLGMGNMCDNVILSLNRAAEDAAGKAKPIFIDAIKHMSIKDVTNIVLGGQNSASQYFQRSTTPQLTLSFKPVIQSSLNKTNATHYYSQVASEYNRLPFVRHINTDLSSYVTQKAIDGLFIEIAKEELNIRQNLAARPTTLLQKVFAFADQHKKSN